MKVKYETCPKCRGYRLESLWCHVCNRTGMVPKQLPDWLAPESEEACPQRYFDATKEIYDGKEGGSNG